VRRFAWWEVLVRVVCARHETTAVTCSAAALRAAAAAASCRRRRAREMHLMYYLDEAGKRVYTLKVRSARARAPTLLRRAAGARARPAVPLQVPTRRASRAL